MSNGGEWQWAFDAVDVMVRTVAMTDPELRVRVADLVSDSSVDSTTLAAMEAHARAGIEAQRVAEKTWPETTTNDRIDLAFADLDASGIVALQNAGYTQSDGWDDVNQLADERLARGPRPRGATFFHGQDVERGVAGEGLLLAFGAYVDDEAARPAADTAIALDVVDALVRRGVSARWSGQPGARIEILPFPWQKRLYTGKEATPVPLPFRAEGARPDTVAREQARLVIGKLLEGGLLELTAMTFRDALEQGLAEELVEWDDDDDDKGEVILDWLVDQRGVAEVFADADEMNRIVAAAQLLTQ